VLKAGETVLQALLRKAFETLQEDGLLWNCETSAGDSIVISPGYRGV
jgi:hypothetical protein